MKSLDELNAIREKAKKDMSVRGSASSRKVVIGMATCGIAAGARPVMSAIIEELSLRSISDIQVTMTGCIGVCRLEPIVEVFEANGDKTTYVKMDAEKARRMVAEHLVNGQICKELAIGAYEK
ncbi:MAG: (2Fe-2S) ferredoxin domain-containing protein [Saccharofermentanales bacterium]